jgi:hypothetical protein
VGQPITTLNPLPEDHPVSPAIRGAACRGRQTRLVPSAEPPEKIFYELDQAFNLLGVLEDARDALIDSGHLAVVVAVETEVRTLSRKLGFDDPQGGTDGR